MAALYGTLPGGEALGPEKSVAPPSRRSAMMRVGVAVLAVAVLVALVAVTAMRVSTPDERLANAPKASTFFTAALAGLRSGRHHAVKARAQQLEEVSGSSDEDEDEDEVDEAKRLVDEAQDRVIEDAQRLKHISGAIEEESSKSDHAGHIISETARGKKDAESIAMEQVERERANLVAAKKRAQAMAVSKMAEAEEARMYQKEAEAAARSAASRAAMQQQQAELFLDDKKQQLARDAGLRANSRERSAVALRVRARRDESRDRDGAARVAGGAEEEGGETIINIKKLVRFEHSSHLALPLLGQPTIPNLMLWVCGTNLSTLKQQQAWAHQIGELENTGDGARRGCGVCAGFGLGVM